MPLLLGERGRRIAQEVRDVLDSRVRGYENFPVKPDAYIQWQIEELCIARVLLHCFV